MKTGVIFPSYLPGAVSNNPGWLASYPSSNALDLVRPSCVARANDAGVRYLSIDLAAPSSIAALALIGHNATPGYDFAYEIYSGPGLTGGVAYAGGLAFWPAGGPVPGLRSIRPHILPAPVVGRSIIFAFPNIGGQFELEGVEVGGFWEWPGISYGREMGVAAEGEEISLVGGASFYPEDGAPRTVTGQVDLMAMAKTSTTGLDFQKGVDIQRPFVWAEDFDDATSWPRKCLLVRNLDLPPMVGALYRHDRFPIRMIEHLR
jgi:hypothetical protein